MPKRKPRETVQINLRIKEELRRRLAKAALSLGGSMNATIIQHIESNLNKLQLRDIDQIAADLKAASEGQHLKNLLGDLVRSAETLLVVLDDNSQRDAAAAKLRQTIAVIQHEDVRRAHTTGGLRSSRLESDQ
jgi:hypothetical protein